MNTVTKLKPSKTESNLNMQRKQSLSKNSDLEVVGYLSPSLQNFHQISPQ